MASPSRARETQAKDRTPDPSGHYFERQRALGTGQESGESNPSLSPHVFSDVQVCLVTPFVFCMLTPLKIIQRLRFTDRGYGAGSGIQCELDPPLMAWMDENILGRFRNCMSRIYKAVNVPGAQPMLDAHQIMAKMGKRYNEGGFDPQTSRKIADSLNHMLKHMM